MVNKRSLTIVELLIVIALLAAMGSIIFPLIGDSLNERAFESAADVTGEQLVLARAHAQATGEPVEVRYHVSSAQVEARLFTPWVPGVESWSTLNLTGVAKPGHHDRDGESSQGEPDSSSKDCIIAEPWANRALSNGIRIVNHRPTTIKTIDPVSVGETAGGILAQLGLPGDSGPDIRLAVFMPDGSALMGAPVWFNDDDGRVGKLTVNPWTGLPIFERVAEASHDDQSTVDGTKSAAEESFSNGVSKKPRSRSTSADRAAPGDSAAKPR